MTRKFLQFLILIFAGGLVFIASVLLLQILIVLSLFCLLLVIIGEIQKKLPHLSWVRYLCFTWLVLIVPTFGIMPLLLASRLHYEIPMGRTLGIFTGFTYTEL